MCRLNPKLEDPLDRLQHAARRAKAVLTTDPDEKPKNSELIRLEIQEIKGALYDFEQAVAADERVTASVS